MCCESAKCLRYGKTSWYVQNNSWFRQTIGCPYHFLSIVFLFSIKTYILHLNCLDHTKVSFLLLFCFEPKYPWVNMSLSQNVLDKKNISKAVVHIKNVFVHIKLCFWANQLFFVFIIPKCLSILRDCPYQHMITVSLLLLLLLLLHHCLESKSLWAKKSLIQHGLGPTYPWAITALSQNQTNLEILNTNQIRNFW